MDNNPALHHIGYVVDSIAGRLEGFRASSSATEVSAIFYDPIQRSRLVFLTMPGSAGGPSLELVEPAGPDSPVTRFLEKGGGLHHLCYAVDSLEEQIRRMKSSKAMLIRAPQPAVAFAGRRIAWMRTREGLLVEYVERGPRSGGEAGVRVG